MLSSGLREWSLTSPSLSHNSRLVSLLRLFLLFLAFFLTIPDVQTVEDTENVGCVVECSQTTPGATCLFCLLREFSLLH